jgi:hypothetical protein
LVTLGDNLVAADPLIGGMFKNWAELRGSVDICMGGC